jgi:hypothetical protein
MKGSSDSTQTSVVVCAWCDRLSIDGKPFTSGVIDVTNTSQNISHGMCPACDVVFTRHLDVLERAWKKYGGEED